MTFTGATASEPNPSLENFTGVAAVARKSPKQTPEPGAPSETDGRAIAEPANVDAAITGIPLDDPALAELAIEPQAPSPQPEPVPLPPVRKPVVTRSAEEICDTLATAARTNNLPVPFFIRLLFQESRFKPGVISPAGAQGIAQFMPDTASDVGLDNPFDPLQAIPASARLLRGLLQQFGNIGLAAAAYNAGPKRTQDWLEKKSKLPEETQGYVRTITGRPAENWKAADAHHPLQKLPRRAPCQDAAGVYAWNGPGEVPMPAPSPHRATAAVKTAKAAPAKAMATTQQLAASKQKHHAIGHKQAAAHKLNKVAQR
jgi:hypothetical protein